LPLVWVTGNAGAGKSAVCALLKARGALAVDADGEGYHHWVDRTSGRVVTDPPDPVPAGWLGRFGWRISRAKVEALAARASGENARTEPAYRRLGATIIDATRPLAEVADTILTAAAGRLRPA
jgi:hypothetical protein